ncbi:cytoskeletal protein binding protein [Irineochytrium annulatum]|nr:cytoskeletal protein binding protein [Irineochytrium annulatum]
MKCKIVAKAVYDYDAQTSEELTLKEGTVLLVTDDSDPDWWTCTIRVTDTFQEAQEGLAPVTYIEEMQPLIVAVALYDYEARTEEEISFSEGAQVLIYENDDPDWWFARIDNEVGLIPATYVSVDGEASAGDYAEDEGQAHEAPIDAAEEAAIQKQKLMGTLGMLGPGLKIEKGPKTERAPHDLKLIPATEVNKKSKKNNRKVLLGVSDEYTVYMCDESEAVLEKWDFKELSKFSDKKGKKLFLEFGADVREFDGEKDDIEKFLKRCEEIKVRSTVSGPIITGALPNVGPPPGSLSGATLPSFAPPPVMPSPASQGGPVITPSPAALGMKPPKIAKALYDYDATTDEELTMREDDNLMVLDDTDADWWKVRLVKKGGGEGLVPATYVELQQPGGDTNGHHADNEEREVEVDHAKVEAENRRKKLEEDMRKQEARERARVEQEREDERREEQKRQQRERERREAEQESGRRERERRESERRDAERRAEDMRKARLTIEDERAPAIPSRPNNAAPPASSVARLNNARPPSGEIGIPSAVPRARADKPSTPRPKSDDMKGSKQPLEKPNEAKVRLWTDRSGTFKVEAEYLNIVDGKVHLHKTNGVKIAVPLEKLSVQDTEFLRRVPGNENIITSSSAPPGRPRPGASAATLASAASASISVPSSSTYVYNGFDWRDWLLKAGVSTGDALQYAQKFVTEKMDRTVLEDIDREVLRRLGISEGDIIRIRKYASTQVASFGGAANASSIAERERQAQARNLQLLGHKDGFQDAQILADEAFARELQKAELAANTTSKGTAGIDARSVLAMKQALNGNTQLSPSSSPPVARASSSMQPVQSQSAPPSASRTESTPTSTSQTVKTLNNDPWATPSSAASNVNSAVAAELQKQAQANAALQAQLLAQQQQAQQLAAQQSQMLAQQQQAAMNAKKQAEIASLQLQQQQQQAQLALQQQQAAALNAKKQAELALAQQQIEAQKVEAQKLAALTKMKEETARLQAQLNEQKIQAASRPLQQPLIPAPQGGPSLGFVPVGQPKMMGAAGMMNMGVAMQPGMQNGMQQSMQPGMQPGMQGMQSMQPLQPMHTGMQQGYGQTNFNQGYPQSPQPPMGFNQLQIAGPAGSSSPAPNANDRYAALRSLESNTSSGFSSPQQSPQTLPFGGMGGVTGGGSMGMMQPTPVMGMQPQIGIQPSGMMGTGQMGQMGQMGQTNQMGIGQIGMGQMGQMGQHCKEDYGVHGSALNWQAANQVKVGQAGRTAAVRAKEKRKREICNPFNNSDAGDDQAFSDLNLPSTASEYSSSSEEISDADDDPVPLSRKQRRAARGVMMDPNVPDMPTNLCPSM